MGVVLLRAARLAAAALGVAAVVTSFVQKTGPASNFFSFFTIESNILAVVVLLLGGVLTTCPRGWPFLRGAVTLYMVITGIVYAALLSRVDVQLQSAWTNAVLHRVLPLVLLVDWLFFPPWPRVRARLALAWLAFPLAYFAYSLLRGPHANFYPYPFLDPRPNGYAHVVGYAIVLAIGMAVLALAIWRIGAQRLAVVTQEVVDGAPG